MNRLIVSLCFWSLLLMSCGSGTNNEPNDSASAAKTPNKTATSQKVNLSPALQAIQAEGKLWGDDKVFDQKAKGYIVVYAPRLDDPYYFDHQLHIAGMYTYFEAEKGEKVETILIGKDDKAIFDDFIETTKSQHPDIFKALTFVNDTDSSLVKTLGLDADHLDHGGVAITYDDKGKALFQEIDYKCQGEKLQHMHQHFYPRKISFPATGYKIEVGKKIPPELNSYFADYMGKQNVLMTFYPAPLSHSCSVQMRTLGNFAVQNMESKDLKVIAVSIGSLQQVEAWQLHQPIKGLEMVADTSGSISNAFNSLLKDEHGVIYSDRTVFLIDKTGMVRYINKDYDVKADLDVLEGEIKKL